MADLDSTTAVTGTLLRSWTPVTTASLEGGSSLAFDVLDHVLETPITELETELSPWLCQRKPAKTQGDVAAVDKNISLLDDATSVVALMSTTTTTTTTTSSRGDKNIFISREDRSAPDFSHRNPRLSHLLTAIHSTCHKKLGHLLEFDDSQTSVQLAVYPGDGTSGYPKHCDRSKNKIGDPKVAQRIITAVYYLTPPDWNCEEDGGCLRVFYSNNDTTKNNNNNNNNEFYYDVVPYSNRMVLFRSDMVEHQVLASKRRDRMALTVWLYGRTTCTTNSSTTRLDQSIKPHQPSVSTCKTLSPPPPPLVVSEESTNLQKDATIFVSIAAYRDSELGPTLSSLMATALYPERVHVGIVLQVDEEADQTMLASLHNELASSGFHTSKQDRVQMLQMSARHARGPCYARDLCQRLHVDEDYVLQIDSHMRFRHNWDAYLIQQIQKCHPETKSMLTTYPVGYQLPNQIPNETRGTLLVPWKFDEDGMLRQRARLFLCPSSSDEEEEGNNNNNNNIPTHLYAAGFNFSCGKVIEDCPYDGRLQHLFFGEEVSMAVRLFTHGYNLYAPPETVCYHLWSRAHRPAPLQLLDDGMNSRQQEVRKSSREVVLQQLRGTGRGLGTARTVSEFAAALGVDFQTKTIRPEAPLGGLQAHNFVDGAAASFCPDGLESQVASLDPKIQARIAYFLSVLS